MQLNRVIALILVVVCFISATLGIQRRQSEARFNLESFESQRDRLELVTLEGVISGSRSPSTGAIAVRNRLQELKDDDRVKGVLLAINSPGGTVGASKEVYQAVLQLRDKKPVVASMLDQAASGGYYVASAATKIYANAGTLTGSIGVILNGLNFQQLLNKVGIESQTIKTGPYKDIFSPFRQISEPERQLLQGVLQSTYQEFVKDISVGRKMDLEAVQKLADGRIFTGRQAQENGLVDAVGTYEDALAELRQQAQKKFNLPENKELPLERSGNSFELFLEQFLNRSSLSASLPPSWSAIAKQLIPQLAGSTTVNLSAELSPTDPPILLMPSWYQ